MRTIAKLFLLLFSLPLAAQTARYTNLCSQGATQAAVSGLKSTNYQESAFPSCTVRVYLHGTTTNATIFSDSINTPLANPFTAGANAIYGFYASTANHYDIVMSATGMTTTTISDVVLGGGGGGACDDCVKTDPMATQTVMQPSATWLQANNLAGAYYAKQYQTGGGDNGIANAFNSSGCSSGCVVEADKSYVKTGTNDEQPGVPAVSGQVLYDYRQGFGIYARNVGLSNPFQAFTNSPIATVQPIRARFSAWQPSTAGRTLEAYITGPGKNIGNPSGNPNSGWAVDHSDSLIMYAERRGIHQAHSTSFYCWAQGDCGGHYMYMNVSGGTPDASGEGAVAKYVRIAEENTYWTGTVASTSGTGDVAPVLVATGIQHFTDGSYLLRTQAASAEADVVSSTSSNGYIDITTANSTFATSTAWGTLATAININQTNAQSYFSSGVVNVTLGLPSATTSAGDFTTGLACIVGQFEDQIMITAASPSVGGTQSIAFQTRYGWPTGAVIMQGAPCSQAYTVDTTWKTPLMIIGATSSTHLIASECSHGNCSSLAGTTPVAPVTYSPGSAATVTRSDGANVVVALNVASGTHIHDFPVGMTITLSGFTPADFNGTCTVSANTQDVYNASLTCPLAGSNGTASVVGSLTQPMTHITGYYAAEIVGTTDGTANKPQLAYNAVPFVVGDAFEDPHTNAMFPTATHYLAYQYSPYDNSPATDGTRYLYEVGGTVPPPVGVGYVNSTGAPLPRAWAYFNGPANNGVEFSYVPSYNGALVKADSYFNGANIRTHLFKMPDGQLDWLQGDLLVDSTTITNGAITNATLTNTTFTNSPKAPNTGYCFTNSTNTCVLWNSGLASMDFFVNGAFMMRLRPSSSQVLLPQNLLLTSGSEFLFTNNFTSLYTTAATSGLNQPSTGNGYRASYWTGSAATPDDWSIVNTPVSNANNPDMQLYFDHWRGTTGRASASFPIVDIRSSATWAGLRIAGQASDPSTLAAGDIWYSTTSDHLKFQDSSTTRTLAYLNDVTNNGTVGSGTQGQIAQYQGAGTTTTVTGATMSGDATIATGGAVTVSKYNGGTSFRTAAGVDTGTSGATIPLLNGTNSWGGQQTYNGTLNLSGGIQVGGSNKMYADTNTLHPWSNNYGLGESGKMWTQLWANTINAGSSGSQFTVSTDGTAQSVKKISSPVYSSATTSNTDSIGSCSVGDGSTSVTCRTFSGTYTNAPWCYVESPGLTPAQKVALDGLVPSMTNTALTVTIGTDPGVIVTVSYHCDFRE